MFIRSLTLHDFRSWTDVTVDLRPEPTIFVGRNGFGKTNLLEAIGYLTTLRSHRVSTDAPLLRAGTDSAKIAATVENSGRELTVEVTLSADRANRATINGSPQRRTRDILGVLRSVLFAPEDLALVRGEPGERRRFLDELVATRGPRWAAARSDYDKVLRQRSALLKTASASLRRGGSDAASVLSTLDVWDAQLAEHGAMVTAARIELVVQLAPHVIGAYAAIAPASRPADLRYRSSIDDSLGTPMTAVDSAPVDSVAASVDDIAAMMLERLKAVRDKEIERGMSLVGPHRDDLELILGDQPAKGFASHGESWSLALSLRLGSVELLRAEGTEPVVLLDDVFAELDAARRAKLVEFTDDVEQVLITAAVGEDIPAGLRGRRLAVDVDESGGSRHSVLTDIGTQVA